MSLLAEPAISLGSERRPLGVPFDVNCHVSQG